MPAYNAARFLRDAIDSVLAQTLADFECLIVDDGSTDETAAIAEEAARADPRVRVAARAHQGLVAALNEGCELAAAPYIARLDADDIAFPDRLERQVAFLDGHPQVALLGGGMRTVNEDGDRLGDYVPPLEHALIVPRMADYNCFHHSSVMFRKSAWRQLGGYRAAVIHAEDYDLWLRMSENYEVRGLTWLMGCYRVHSDQISANYSRQQAISASAARAAARLRRSGACDPLDSVEAGDQPEALLDRLARFP